MSADAKVITNDQSRKATRTRHLDRVADRHDVDPPTGDQLDVWTAIRDACRDADDLLVDGAQYKAVRTDTGHEIRYRRWEWQGADVELACDEWVANVHLVRGGVVQMPPEMVDRHQPLVAALEEAGIDVAID